MKKSDKRLTSIPIALTILVIIVSVLLTACESISDSNTYSEQITEQENVLQEKETTASDITEEKVTSSVTEITISEDKNTTSNTVAEKTSAVTTEVSTSEEKPKYFNHQANRAKLTQAEQKIYDEYIEAILNYKEFIVDFAKVPYDYETFYKVNDEIRRDYPETRLYLFTDESIRDETHNGNPRFISVGYDYNWLTVGEFSAEYMDSYLHEMDLVCDSIIAEMPEGLSYTKQYEFLGREICSRTVYVDKSDWDIPYEEVSWSWCYMNGPLLEGEGLCQAYAYAYQYLCHRAGLWCITASGGCHAWNMVMLEDGSTYHVDLTWADVEWEEDGFDESYFLMTQAECEVDHIHEEKDVWSATGT